MRVLPIVVMVLVSVPAVTGCRGGASGDSSVATPPPGAQVGWDEVLSWLPADTESILALNGPLAISEMKGLPAESALPAVYSMALIWSRKSVQPMVTEVSIEFALTAGRDFRSPRALGSTTFEGASIVRLSRDSIPAGERWFRTLQGEADSGETLEGAPVVVIHEQWEADEVTLWSARPREDILVTATDAEFLEEILRRIRGSATGRARALPGDLPEWAHVDTTARCWGVRHYRRPATRTDPTSPILGGSPVFGLAEPGAIGCVYSSAKSDDPSIRVVYLSNSDEALTWVEQEWITTPQNPEDVPWTTRAIAPGIIEIQSEKTSPGSIYWLVLFATFGHALYL